MKSVAFCTLGCKVNQYETEAMSELFKKAGYCEVSFDEFADVYVINTCTVTAMSDRKSRQMIRRAKRVNPNAFLVVCGCYAQTAPQEVAKIKDVDLILGTNERANIVAMCEEKIKKIVVTDIMHNHCFENLQICDYSERTRAYVKIQEGCNQFCTYCIIPFARGPIRSRPIDDIVKESQRLVANGFSEIVYVGIHVASYGLDTKECDLADLIIRMNQIDGIKRIRLSSIEPMYLNNEFCEKIKDCEKLCHHFHLSLQSGCDETLKRMNRRYTTEEYKGIVEGLRKNFSDCAITTDIMVGFAGETEEEFAKTVEFVKDISFSDAHIFKYSRRSGTPADKMPNQISPQIKEKRSKILIDLCKKSRDEFIGKFLDKPLLVLFETKNGEYYEGKTSNYITVMAKSDKDVCGEYHDVICTSSEDGILFGEVAE